MKLILPLFALALIAAGGPLACRGDRSPTPNRSRAPSSSADEPERIVSIAPSVTEILVALGLERRIVGVTDWCELPSSATDIVRIGGFSTPIVERILALDPDLVIYTPSAIPDARAFHDGFARAGVDLFPIEVDGTDGVIRAIEAIAERSSKGDAGRELANRVRRDVDATTMRFATRRRPRVMVVVSRDPRDLYVAGRGTFVAEMLERAGGENVAADGRGFYAMTLEAILSRRPEILVDAGGLYAAGGSRSEATPSAPSRSWSECVAFLQARGVVVRVATSDSVVRPGPRIASGIASIATLIHGEGLDAK